MIPSMRTLAWLRDLVIAVLFIAALDLRHSSPRLALLLLFSAVIIFLERFLWSWYLLNLRDRPDQFEPTA
jgi:hypothetical protein